MVVAHWGLERPALVGHDIGGGVVTRAHLVEEVPVSALALVDAAVLGPWNTPFTEHMQRHAEAYRTMPPDVFADIVGPRLRTATHRPMADRLAAAIPGARRELIAGGGHFLPEDRPEEVAGALLRFLGEKPQV
ncbi:alpha/beta fold hydrolase [Streptomyces coryli]|uniref:alpha/beta fold hydrolase n=1 Tax=Streptomyces coryli TaxID=1128680 RepID=UPI0019D19DCF|nr:hypothetical protein [Streptomyces coryli]